MQILCLRIYRHVHYSVSLWRDARRRRHDDTNVDLHHHHCCAPRSHCLRHRILITQRRVSHRAPGIHLYLPAGLLVAGAHCSRLSPIASAPGVSVWLPQNLPRSFERHTVIRQKSTCGHIVRRCFVCRSFSTAPAAPAPVFRPRKCALQAKAPADTVIAPRPLHLP